MSILQSQVAHQGVELQQAGFDAYQLAPDDNIALNY